MENLINPNLDLDKLRKKFKKEGYIVIDNYLKDEVAEDLYKFFNYEMPSEWWSIATYPSENDDNVNYLKKISSNDIFITQARQVAEKSFGEGHFSYSFHRTLDNHYEKCGCTECKIREFLNEKDSHDLISKITDLKITGSNEVFAACYLPGYFLSPHQDHPNGIVGFVLHLTKDWKPQYGGLLHFLNDEGDVVENVETPKFNSMTLFLLPENKGKLHFVSHVNPGCPEIRVSLTGWYKN